MTRWKKSAACVLRILRTIYNTIDPPFFYSGLHDASLFKYNKANDRANNDFEIIVALFPLWNRWIRNLANVLKYFFFFFFFLEISLRYRNIKYFEIYIEA